MTQPPEQAAPLVAIKAIVERVTYHNPENGYSVLKVAVPDERDLVTVVGHFSAVTAGESMRLVGTWGNHPKHGPQFKVVKYDVEAPATLIGLVYAVLVDRARFALVLATMHYAWGAGFLKGVVLGARDTVDRSRHTTAGPVPKAGPR